MILIFHYNKRYLTLFKVISIIDIKINILQFFSFDIVKTVGLFFNIHTHLNPKVDSTLIDDSKYLYIVSKIS